MVDLQNQLIKINDKIYTIEKYNDDKIYIVIDNVEKSFKYRIAFKSGYISAVDENLQKQIIEDIISNEETEQNNDSGEKEVPIIIPPINPKTKRIEYRQIGDSSAYMTYRQFAKKFNWNENKSGAFHGKGQLLWARDCTPEGYSVWCIAHSNLTATKGGKWKNKIYEGGKFIDEEWDNTEDSWFKDDTEVRAVFVKEDGYYRFYGIYVCQKVDEVKGVKTYERMSKTYPEE